MRDFDQLFADLNRSAFRRRFRLAASDLDYFHKKGLAIILEHARDFVTKRLAPADPPNDGKQTPMRVIQFL